MKNYLFALLVFLSFSSVVNAASIYPANNGVELKLIPPNYHQGTELKYYLSGSKAAQISNLSQSWVYASRRDARIWWPTLNNDLTYTASGSSIGKFIRVEITFDLDGVHYVMFSEPSAHSRFVDANGDGYGDIDIAPNLGADKTINWLESKPVGAVVFNANDVFTQDDYDRDGDTITYSLSDYSDFSIDAQGRVRFNTTPDYESSTKQYQVTVYASSYSNVLNQALIDQMTLTINILNADDNPTTGTVVVTPTGTVVAGTQLSVNANIHDADGPTTIVPTIQWQRKVSGVWQNIAHANQQNYTTTLDDEGRQVKAVASYIDGANASASKESNVVTVKTASGPEIIGKNLTVPENSTAIFYNVNDKNTNTDTDTDGNPITYSLEGTNASSFSINAQGLLKFKTPADYESKPQYSFVVVAKSGLKVKKASFTVSVLNLNDNNPTGSVSITPTGVVARNVQLTVVQNLADNDGISSAGVSLQWQRQTASGWVDIAGQTTNTYTTELADEGKKIQVVASYTDGSGAKESKVSNPVSVKADNAPEIGGDITQAIDENNLFTHDFNDQGNDKDQDGDAINYTLSGTDANDFNLNAATGVLTLKQAANFEVKASYNVTVKATANGKSDTVNVSLTVNNLDEPHTGSVSVSAPAPIVNKGTTLTASNTLTDPDGPTPLVVTYQWQREVAGVWQNISGATAANYVTQNADSGKKVRVKASFTDGSGHAQTVYSSSANAISIKDDQIAEIKNININVDENTTAVIATMVDNNTGTNKDIDGDAITFGLDASSQTHFTIDSQTGALSFKSGQADYETQTVYSATVTAVSNGKSGTSGIVKVTLNNLDDNNPTAINDKNSKADKIDTAAKAGTLANVTAHSTDADNNAVQPNFNKINYALSKNPNGYFAIDANTGVVTTTAAIKGKVHNGEVLSIEVSATSAPGKTVYKSFSISVVKETDSDGDGEGDSTDPDPNNACVPNNRHDNCDYDKDGIKNGTDDDDDNDGVPDTKELTEQGKSNENTDSDYDGVADGQKNAAGKLEPLDKEPLNKDNDSDNDGLTNWQESGDKAHGANPLGTDPLKTDSDNDGVNDKVEVVDVDHPRDSDKDGTIDALDADDDGDGKNTRDELNSTGAIVDTDGDGAPDYIDLDSDGDGIKDATDNTVNVPANSNGGDSDGDGFSDKEECNAQLPEACKDSDKDGQPDHLDLDSDNNGVNDKDELTPNIDTDGDGIKDRADTDDDGDGKADADEISDKTKPMGDDADGDGIPSHKDADETTGSPDSSGDSDKDGYSDTTECAKKYATAPIGCVDTDKDGIPDYMDTDSDNDGILDKDDKDRTHANWTDHTPNADTDNDGIKDGQDDDDDGDGIKDVDEITDPKNPTADDKDGDGIPSYKDADESTGLPDSSGDSDKDGVSDRVECARTNSINPANCVDTDKDGTPDYMDTDSDNDGLPDNIDNNRTDPDADKDGYCDGPASIPGVCKNPNTRPAPQAAPSAPAAKPAIKTGIQGVGSMHFWTILLLAMAGLIRRRK